MKRTAPAVKAIIEAVIKDRELVLNEDQLETLLRDGKPMDVKIVTALSPDKPYSHRLMAVAKSFAD